MFCWYCGMELTLCSNNFCCEFLVSIVAHTLVCSLPRPKKNVNKKQKPQNKNPGGGFLILQKPRFCWLCHLLDDPLCCCSLAVASSPNFLLNHVVYMSRRLIFVENISGPVQNQCVCALYIYIYIYF